MNNFTQNQTRDKLNNQTTLYRITYKDKIFMSIHSIYTVVFLLIIIAVFYKLDDVFSLNTSLSMLIDFITHSVFLLILSIISLILLGFFTYLFFLHIKYNNFQITSNKDSIHIEKGNHDGQHTTIQRAQIRHIVIEKTIARWLFQIVTIKVHYRHVTSTSESLQTITLVPFIQERRAKQLIEEMLPDYVAEVHLETLPTEAYFVELIQPNYTLVILTFLIMFFWPELWFILIFQALYLIIKRVLKTKRQQYRWTHDIIAIRTGSFSPSLHIVKHNQITMLQIHQSWIQRKLRLATCQLSTPEQSIELEHVTEDVIEKLYDWFIQQERQ